MKVTKVERKIEAAKCSRESTGLQPDKVSVVNFVNFQIQGIHPPGPVIFYNSGAKTSPSCSSTNQVSGTDRSREEYFCINRFYQVVIRVLATYP